MIQTMILRPMKIISNVSQGFFFKSTSYVTYVYVRALELLSLVRFPILIFFSFQEKYKINTLNLIEEAKAKCFFY